MSDRCQQCGFFDCECWPEPVKPGGPVASELIREAVAITRWRWPDVPELGMVSFVDTTKVDEPSPAETPNYETPDPYLRRLPAETFPFRSILDGPGLPIMQGLVDDTLPDVPIHTLLGIDEVDSAEGMLAMTINASRWLCAGYA